jgi:hypothetical protein
MCPLREDNAGFWVRVWFGLGENGGYEATDENESLNHDGELKSCDRRTGGTNIIMVENLHDIAFSLSYIYIHHYCIQLHLNLHHPRAMRNSSMNRKAKFQVQCQRTVQASSFMPETRIRQWP